MKNQPFHARLLYALNGVEAAWRRESSVRTQSFFAAGALVFLVLLRPPWIWWALVVLTICFVLAAELMNSAFEALIDFLHPDAHSEIKAIKDMAAGSVLMASLGALAIGGLLLLATLWP